MSIFVSTVRIDIINGRDAETATMHGLLEETQNNIVDLVKAWRNETRSSGRN